MVQTRRGRGGEEEVKQNEITEGPRTRGRKENVVMEKEKQKTPIKRGGSVIKKQVSPTKKSPIKNLVFTASPGRSTYSSKLRTPTRKEKGKGKNNEMDVDGITTRMNKVVLEMSPPQLSQDSAISMDGNLSESSSSLDGARDVMTPPPSECIPPISSSLATEVIPLPGREKQFSQLISLVDGSVDNKEPLFIYISGRPGTGKSATTEQVLEQLAMPPRRIKTCMVNCMGVSKGDDLAAAIMSKVEKPCPAGTALSSFTSFVAALKNTFLLVLDEADFVDERALATISTMPVEVSAHLIVIGIANTIDLTERSSIKKIKLKIKPVLMVFPRYTHDEMVAFLNFKQKDLPEGMRLDTIGIDLCARKVSAVTGDAREAMSVMRVMRMGKVEEEEKMDAETTNENVPSTPLAPRSRVADLRKIADVIHNVQNSPLSRIRLQTQPKVLLAICLKLSASKKKLVLTRGTLLNEYRKASAHKDARWQMAEGCDLDEAFEMLISLNFISLQKGQIMMQVNADVARKAIFDNEIIKAIDYIL